MVLPLISRGIGCLATPNAVGAGLRSTCLRAVAGCRPGLEHGSFAFVAGQRGGASELRPGFVHPAQLGQCQSNLSAAGDRLLDPPSA
jgi:hypothetical protein